MHEQEEALNPPAGVVAPEEKASTIDLVGFSEHAQKRVLEAGVEHSSLLAKIAVTRARSLKVRDVALSHVEEAEQFLASRPARKIETATISFGALVTGVGGGNFLAMLSSSTNNQIARDPAIWSLILIIIGIVLFVIGLTRK